MPTTKYLCTNFAGCNKAIEREVIEIEDGEEPLCPEKECGCKLEPIRKPGPMKIPKWLFAALAVVLVTVGLGFWLAHQPAKPNPAAADKMLSDFYPQLPPK
jgi:hypothetical protein